MKQEEILRYIDSLHRDKNIPREKLFQGLENALIKAVMKVNTEVEPEEIVAQVDRRNGSVAVTVNGKPIDIEKGELGRIAAQTTRQELGKCIREAVRDKVVDEISAKVHTLVTVEVQRRERGDVIVDLNGVEARIPPREQIPTEHYRTGDRLRCYVMSLNTSGIKANVELSRARPELVHELFIADVPEIADGLIEVMELAREPGFRTKIAVHCEDERIDCVGACVGPRGTRIRNIINELGGEKIDIIRWDPSPEEFIKNALAPARISRVYIDPDSRQSIVVVPDEHQLSLAIGKKGQNVRLTCKLTRWQVEVQSETEFQKAAKDEMSENDEGIELADVPPADAETEPSQPEQDSASLNEALNQDDSSQNNGDESEKNES